MRVAAARPDTALLQAHIEDVTCQLQRLQEQQLATQAARSDSPQATGHLGVPDMITLVASGEGDREIGIRNQNPSSTEREGAEKALKEQIEDLSEQLRSSQEEAELAQQQLIDALAQASNEATGQHRKISMLTAEVERLQQAEHKLLEDSDAAVRANQMLRSDYEAVLKANKALERDYAAAQARMAELQRDLDVMADNIRDAEDYVRELRDTKGFDAAQSPNIAHQHATARQLHEKAHGEILWMPPPPSLSSEDHEETRVFADRPWGGDMDKWLGMNLEDKLSSPERHAAGREGEDGGGRVGRSDSSPRYGDVSCDNELGSAGRTRLQAKLRSDLSPHSPPQPQTPLPSRHAPRAYPANGSRERARMYERERLAWQREKEREMPKTRSERNKPAAGITEKPNQRSPATARHSPHSVMVFPRPPQSLPLLI